MKRLLSCLLVTILVSQVALAQSQPAAQGDWTDLSALKRGDSVRVDFKDGKSWSGKLESHSPDKLSLQRDRLVTDVSRTDISTLYRTRKSIGKSVAIGSLIGVGSGSTLGFIAGETPCRGFLCFTRGEGAAAGAVVGAGIGALAGLVIGAVRNKKTVIYRAR